MALPFALDLVGDDRPARRARLLYAVLWVMLGVNALSAILMLPMSDDWTLSIASHTFAGALEVAGLLAVRRGHVEVAARVVIAALVGLFLALGPITGGIHGMMPYLSFGLLVLAYFIVGARGGAIVGVALLLWSIGLVLGDPWIAEPPPTSALQRLTGLLLTGGGIAAIVHAAISRSEASEDRREALLVEITKAEESKRRAFEAMSDGLAVLDEGGVVRDANPRALALLGWDPDTIGSAPSEVAGVPISEVMAEGAIEARPDTRVLRLDTRRDTDGNQRVCVITDVTTFRAAEQAQREAAEAAREASRTKSSFLANMSHELRTPLNAILGYSEMLAEEIDDETQVADIQRIHRAGRHLLALINDVLDLSKIEAGRMEVVSEQVDLDRLLDDVVATARPLAAANGNTLVDHREPPLGWVYSDSQRLLQVLLNLLSNACKFTSAGTVTLQARRSDDILFVEVSDTGIGISDEHLARIFQPFVQAEASTTRRFGGTGLGLMLSRRFAEMLGGQLDVTSELGVGSTFTLRLPCAARSRADATATAPLPGLDGMPVVVCIDDDESVHDLLGRMLAAEGFQAIRALDGQSGLAAVRDRQPVAVTLDLELPDIPGWEVLARLKQDPSTRTIPTIVLTALDNDGRGAMLGASDYLVKPVGRDRLREALRVIRRDPGTVLVVDDDKGAREVLRRRLTASGWAVVEAADGREAVAMLATDPLPDAMLLDIMMPVMDGFEVIAHVRSTERLRTLPVIVLTALDLDDDLRARLDGVVQSAFSKPTVDLATIAVEVRRLAAARAAKATTPPGISRARQPAGDDETVA